MSLKGLLSLDGAAHHRQRRLVSKAFTPRSAERLRTTCTEVIAELVDSCAGEGRCDVVADIARQYPIPIICAMLGTPREDWHLFSAWADDIFKVFDWNVVNDEPDIMRAWRALERYVDDMVTSRRDALTDDLLSDMMRAEVDGDRLTHDELLTLAATLLMAGTDTTRNQLAAAVQVFCEHPDQWRTPRRATRARSPRPCDEADALLPRHLQSDCACRSRTSNSRASGSPRARLSSRTPLRPTATPAVYTDPDRFDITREDAPAMLTFGGGVHYCLGAHLARIELAEALTTMARRMPNIRTTGPVPWKSMTGITGPASLPIEFKACP